MSHPKHPFLIAGCAVLVAGAVAGCMEPNRLSQYAFDGRTLAIEADYPETPFADFAMQVDDALRPDVPGERTPPSLGRVLVETIIDEVQAPGARRFEGPYTDTHALIDSVLAAFDMGGYLIDRLHERGAEHLNLQPVDDPDAAYRLHAVVTDYGLGADGWGAPVYFEFSGSVDLVDAATGQRIWSGETYRIVPVSKVMLAYGMPVEKTSTARGLATCTYEEMEDVLAGLARYAADELTAALREDYRQSRGREVAG